MPARSGSRYARERREPQAPRERLSNPSAENISKSYISRILRLALLAPDIVEAILDGQADQALMLETLERPLPARRDEQLETSKKRGEGGAI